jgi:hypothetical protein
MSGQDVLDRASRALCDQARKPSAQVSRTRALVMLRASRRVRRSRTSVVLFPIAAVLAVSSAWASAQGGGVRVWTRVESLVASVEEKIEARPRERPRPVAAADVPAPAASHAEEDPARIPELAIDALPPAEPTPSAAPATTIQRRPAIAGAAVHAETAIDGQAARLYAAAHHAHFVDRDPPRALRAWDDFLAYAPNDPLAPEARYNRALTLVRLDRRAEARLALEPFAQGAFGPYRVREAQALLDALSR